VPNTLPYKVRKGRYRGTDVAIKILHTQDEENTAMFFKEAELMCKLRHPNVIQCKPFYQLYSSFSERGLTELKKILGLGASVAPPNLSIVMELMNSNLSRFIRSGPIEDKIMVKVAIGIARGINFLHTAKPKIIHRDLKPDNILVRSLGNYILYMAN
jgi:serine/threonine protein kinase